MKRRYALGSSDFKETIEKGKFFLDKSMLVKEFLEEIDQVVLIPRPRRFGKSLNMSMLRYFLEVGGDSKVIFEGLAISNDEESMKYMNKYPVIYMNFRGTENSNWSIVARGIEHVVAEEYRRHAEVKSVLDKDELASFENITSMQSGVVDLQRSLLNLSRYLEKYYKEKVVILIDEYDSPMNHMYEQKEFQDSMYFFRSFYVNALKDNPSLGKALMTGIMGVAKEGIFSGLNNVVVHTILSEKYGEYFGFLEEEIRPLIEEEGLSITEAREWYNGYNFGGRLIYNPWSIINYLKWKRAQAYWENTSNNQLIRELVKKGGPQIKYGLELLLKGEPTELEIRENVNLKELREGDIWSLFLQAGYLTYEDREEKRVFRLPNREVRGFLSQMMNEVSEITEKRRTMEQALEVEDWSKFEKELKKSVLRSVSYYDIQRKNVGYNENFYHALLVGMLITMEAYEVRSNLESGLGRADIVLKRKDRKGAVVIELKAGEQDSEMEELLEEAEDQVKRKRYGEDLEGPVAKLAIAFKGKEAAVRVLPA